MLQASLGRRGTIQVRALRGAAVHGRAGDHGLTGQQSGLAVLDHHVPLPAPVDTTPAKSMPFPPGMTADESLVMREAHATVKSLRGATGGPLSIGRDVPVQR